MKDTQPQKPAQPDNRQLAEQLAERVYKLMQTELRQARQRGVRQGRR